MKRLLLCALALVWIAAAGLALAEQRFPPPDFDGGHQIPLTATPSPRPLGLAWMDVAVLGGSLALASYFVVRLRSRRAVFWLSLFSLAYFGFYRKGCVCSIGSIQNLALAMFDATYQLPLTVAFFFLAPLVVALFAGRTFCAAVCPHGALQDLALLKPIKVPGWLEHGLSVLPFIYLGIGAALAATGSTFLICRYDPFVPLFRRSGSLTMLALGLGFVALAVFVGRPYCRFLCPYGALLRLAGSLSKWRVRITPDACTQCRLCEDSCPYGAIRKPAVYSPDASTLGEDRRRLGRYVVLLPALVLVCAWLGSQLSAPASRLHPTVNLAEKLALTKLQPGTPTARPSSSVPTPESLALGRAEDNPKELLESALAIRRRFNTAGWVFGGWVGLVIGVKLISLSMRSARTDYEPDRGACLACARCFLSCPNEHVRLGRLTGAGAAASPVAIAQPMVPGS